MTTNAISVAGVFPPLPTPFKVDQTVDLDNLQANLEHLNQFDLRGYVLLGSNGEFANLSFAERIEVIKAGRAVIPNNKLLIAGTAAQSTYHTLKLTEQAAAAGADLALILTPNYYKGAMTGSVLVKHFHEVADQSPIPVLLYNMPLHAHIDMDAGTILQAAEHPNIIGMKESGANLGKSGMIIAKAANDFQFLTGSANLILPALTIGAVGGIMALANIAPQPLIDLVAAFHAGDLARARQLQHRLIPANVAITATFGISGLKNAMQMLGLYGGPVRRPLPELSEEKREVLRKILIETEILI